MTATLRICARPSAQSAVCNLHAEKRTARKRIRLAGRSHWRGVDFSMPLSVQWANTNRQSIPHENPTGGLDANPDRFRNRNDRCPAARGSWVSAIMDFFSQLGTEDFYFIVMPMVYWSIDAALGIRISVILLGLNGILTCVAVSLSRTHTKQNTHQYQEQRTLQRIYPKKNFISATCRNSLQAGGERIKWLEPL